MNSTCFLAAWAAAFVSLTAGANFDPAAHPEYVFMPNRTWAYQSRNEFVRDLNLGYRHPSDARIHHVTRTLEQVLWDTTLEFDHYGNRVVPQENPRARTRFLAFLGCSFTLGTGLNAEDSLPAQVARYLPQHKVYNFAIGSSGPNLHLARAEAGEFRDAIAETSGAFVYVPIDAHIGRVNGFYEESAWMRDTPFYEKGEDGELHRAGSLRTAHPLRTAFYDWIRERQARWLPGRRFNFPPVLRSHSTYLCEIVTATARRLKEDFPDSTFIVANHPMVKLRDSALDCLRDRGITVVNFDAWSSYDPRYIIPLDKHPSGRFNRDFSPLLARELEPLLAESAPLQLF